MAKRQESKAGEQEATLEPAPTEAPAPPPEKRDDVLPPPVTEIRVSFNAWFASTGRPPHHKGPMLAWIERQDGEGRRTAADWNAAMKAY